MAKSYHPGVSPGMALLAVDGNKVLSYAEAVRLLHAAGRPARLRFRPPAQPELRPEPEPEPEPELEPTALMHPLHPKVHRRRNSAITSRRRACPSIPPGCGLC